MSPMFDTRLHTNIPNPLHCTTRSADLCKLAHLTCLQMTQHDKLWYISCEICILYKFQHSRHIGVYMSWSRWRIVKVTIVFLQKLAGSVLYGGPLVWKHRNRLGNYCWRYMLILYLLLRPLPNWITVIYLKLTDLSSVMYWNCIRCIILFVPVAPHCAYVDIDRVKHYVLEKCS